MAVPSQSRPAAAGPFPWRTPAALSALMLVFLAEGWPFVKKLGIEVDEAMVGNGIFPGAGAWYSWKFFGNEIPVMLLTYLGALKTWLYNPLFAIFPPGPMSLRLPMLMVGAFTVVLFFLLVDHAANRRAAWIGAALLATDPTFILTESIDLGFVALQHAFKLGALLLLVAFHRAPSAGRLAGAFFLFGLAMWDKAVFSWVLAGIVGAGALVFWREIRQHLRTRNLLIAVAGFIVGAFPLIVYNIQHPLETFTRSANLATQEDPRIKLIVTRRAFDGSGLFGFLTAPDEGPKPAHPHGLTQRTAFAVSDLFGGPTTNWMLYAFAFALAAVPLVWKTPARRPVLFAIVYLLLTWLLMFLTPGAGGAVHHIVLLWPFHLFLIAIVLSQVSQRMGRYAVPVLVLITGLACGSNLLVTNEYYVSLVRNGTAVRWTDAFSPLNSALFAANSPSIFIADWGILETLNLLSEGDLPVLDASVPLRSPAEAANRNLLNRMLATEGALWVTHTPQQEQWTGLRSTLLRVAESAGYSQELLQTILDRNGRPIFEIFRFRRAG